MGGGQRAADLQVGGDPESALLADGVERGDPLFRVRSADQRDGACSGGIAVDADLDRRVLPAADHRVVRGDRPVLVDDFRAGLRVDAGRRRAVEVRARTGVEPGVEVVGVDRRVRCVPLPDDGRRACDDRRDYEQGGERDTIRAAETGVPSGSQRSLDVPGRQPREQQRYRENRSALIPAHVVLEAPREVEDEQRPMPQVERVGHRTEPYQPRVRERSADQPCVVRRRVAGGG